MTHLICITQALTFSNKIFYLVLKVASILFIILSIDDLCEELIDRKANYAARA